MVAVYIVVVGWQVTGAGLRVRDAVWTSSRTIRFDNDIANAYHWGEEVVALARKTAANPEEPTFWELVRAEGGVYRNLVENSGTEDYKLDYPPARLLTMALWRRHVDREHPRLPGRWVGWTDALRPRGDPATSATEEIAAPLLAFNTISEAAAALLAAALVGLWVWRSADRRRRPHADGVLAFMVCAAALFYAMRVAVFPSPSPPPAVTINGPPAVYLVAGGRSGATISATINPQGAAAQWYVQWGTAEDRYSHIIAAQGISGATDVAVTAELKDLPAKTTIHYRIVARNDTRQPTDIGRGMTQTDDATFVTDTVVQPRQPSATFGAVWLSVPQWLGVGVVFVAMCWAMRRMDTRHRAWASAMLAGALVWFNPALLIDAHAWPQWDAWVLAPFLLAALLASLDWWFVAGLVIGIGMMFKGQFLIGMPVLIVWPIVALQWRAAVRLLVGFAVMAGLLLSPWITLASKSPYEAPEPLRWIKSVMIAAIIGVLISLLRRRARVVAARTWRRFRERRATVDVIEANDVPADSVAIELVETSSSSLLKIAALSMAVVAGLVVATVLVLRPWPVDADVLRKWGVALLAAMLVMPWFLRRRSLGVWGAAVLAAAIWLSPWLFHGDWSWKVIGFEYGANKFDRTAMGEGSNGNLASILARRFGWDLHDSAMSLRLPNLASLGFSGSSPDRVPRWLHDWGLNGQPLTLDLKQTMIAIFAVLLILSGLAAAVQARRRDPRVLAALVAPWVLMPNLLCQMMCRYQLWGAVLSAMLVAIAPELALLNVLISVLAAGMIGNQLLNDDPSRSPQIHELIGRLSPDSGWIMLAAAAIILFLALTPGRSHGRGRLLKS